MNAVTVPRPAFLAWLFTPHPAHDGVRPFHVYVLRTLYVLMFLGVGIPVWSDIFAGRMPTDHVRAVEAA